MTIAVDTAVLLDLLGNRPGADAAEACLRIALGKGPVVVCPVVLAELSALLGEGATVVDVLDDMGIRFDALDQRSAVRAGEMQRKFRQRAAADAAITHRGISDFLIGAHAMLQCDGLISRDAVFFRDYFKGLKVIEPTTN
ncbi:type II toxin-antitoxin system VapC family toxin [Piscinibacter sakaiensis]|uniref:type II toxin-antitoxin system VapC family toxin n=1 Tax=Piscinibacter sakaiensis TaxID=1547922 RepID=UPI003AAA765B